MGKIWLKSGKIVKIRWNRAKIRFQTRFYAFGTKQQLCATVPSSSRCQSRIGLLAITQYTLHTVTEQKKIMNTLQSSSFFIDFHTTQVNNNQNPDFRQQLSSSLFSFSQPSKFQQSTTGPPPITLFLTSHREIQISDNNSSGSPVIQSPPAIVSYSIYLFSPSANSIMI